MNDLIYRNSTEISMAIRDLIDRYWRKETTREDAMSIVTSIFGKAENRAFVLRGDCFTVVFQAKLGKRRLQELRTFLVQIDKEKYSML